LIYNAQKVTLGFRSLVGFFSSDLSGGYEFNRSFFEAASASSHNPSSADLAPSWFMEAKLSLRFN